MPQHLALSPLPPRRRRRVISFPPPLIQHSRAAPLTSSSKRRAGRRAGGRCHRRTPASERERKSSSSRRTGTGTDTGVARPSVLPPSLFSSLSSLRSFVCPRLRAARRISSILLSRALFPTVTSRSCPSRGPPTRRRPSWRGEATAARNSPLGSAGVPRESGRRRRGAGGRRTTRWRCKSFRPRVLRNQVVKCEASKL